MIFDNNTTALGASVIPMDEAYNCPYGTALALVEGARSELAMFEAMLGIDAREMRIRSEYTGVMAEGELTTLSEAAVGGIWKKIKEIFAKLVAKVKAIFHNFMSKINGLVMKDKDLVKKYEKELMRKTNLGNLEVKWAKVKKSPLGETLKTAEFSSLDTFAGRWKEEASARVEEFLGCEAGEFDQKFHEDHFEDEDTVKLSTVGGIRSIIGYLNDFSKKSSDMNTAINKLTTALEKLVKEADKRANQLAKDKAPDEEIKKANKVYDMAQAYQTATLKENQAILNAIKYEYKQNKAAFMKAVSANDKKLEESALYLDAVAEAACQEVEDVICGAIGKEELSKICNASKAVKDADVSDDPDKLTYGPNCYTHNGSYVPTDGSVDSTIVGKHESAEFGEMLY